MAAVAKAAGAPSGSLYHRFPDRAALLAALWLRTLRGFHDGYLDVLTGDADPRRTARAAARHVVEWSRAHPAEARVLRYGAADFGRDSWPAAARAELDEANERVFTAIGGLAERLGATGAAARERVQVALVDVPYALVQRHLRGGTDIPGHAADTAEECAAALLP
jgi:AcrR family transcriptional regulator